MSLKIFLLIAFRGICSAYEQLLFKRGTNSLDSHEFKGASGYFRFISLILRMPRIWLAFLVIAIGWAVWFVVLSSADLSLAAPATSMEYIAVMGVAYFFLKENICRRRIIGALLVIIGVCFLAVS
jgi:drug/metabolite transporter (DMT)-like permease